MRVIRKSAVLAGEFMLIRVTDLVARPTDDRSVDFPNRAVLLNGLRVDRPVVTVDILRQSKLFVAKSDLLPVPLLKYFPYPLLGSLPVRQG